MNSGFFIYGEQFNCNNILIINSTYRINVMSTLLKDELFALEIVAVIFTHLNKKIRFYTYFTFSLLMCLQLSHETYLCSVSFFTFSKTAYLYEK